MLIIPAIDLIDGKCVRLTQGDYAQKKVYNENPLEVAKQFEDIGISHLHLVDLDGAKAGKVINLNILETIAKQTNLLIDFGGGIKTNESIKSVFDAGAYKATIGSIAIKNSALFKTWVNKYSPERILLGADVKDEKIAIGGWIEDTQINLFDFIRDNMKIGINTLFCTDIAKDGLLQGPSIELYSRVLNTFPTLKLIASGGVSNYNDLTLLKEIGCYGAIVGKAIYENKISLNEIKTFISC